MLLVWHEAAGAPRGGWTRDADGWAVVLKAMGTMKAEPLSWIAKECPRSGMVISPGLESKLCLKPKKVAHDAHRVQYRAAGRHEQDVGYFVALPHTAAESGSQTCASPTARIPPGGGSKIGFGVSVSA